MNNQRGLTLLELLAAIIITGIIISVSIALFMSISSQFFTSSETYISQSQMRNAINKVSNELAQASKVLYNQGELRYKQGGKYKSLYYSNHQLWLYHFNDSGDAAQLEDDFADITFSPAATPGKYTDGVMIADKLAQEPMYENGATHTSLDATPLSLGAAIAITLQFQYDRTQANGVKVSVTDANKMKSSVTVKLIEDY